MTMKRPTLPLVIAAFVGAMALPLAQQAADTVTVPLSDAARPVSVRVETMNGTIIVRGENRKDVLVTSRGDNDNNRNRAGRGRGGRGNDNQPESAGLMRLTQGAGLTITEANNLVSVESGMSHGGDIELRVPTRANLRLEGLNGSGVTVENVEGDIETEHLNGSIRLTNVAGSVVAEATNGNVIVVLNRITADKAMSFVTFNGNVDVTLPPTAKANLRMSSDNGDVYTDFDVQVRQTPAPPPRRNNGRFQVEMNRAITGTINGGGPEFELRTFNGNIYLRRAKQ
jgi:hypothetical protein